MVLLFPIPFLSRVGVTNVRQGFSIPPNIFDEYYWVLRNYVQFTVGKGGWENQDVVYPPDIGTAKVLGDLEEGFGL